MTALSLLRPSPSLVDISSKNKSEFSPLFPIAPITTLIQTSILSHWDNYSVSSRLPCVSFHTWFPSTDSTKLQEKSFLNSKYDYITVFLSLTYSLKLFDGLPLCSPWGPQVLVWLIRFSMFCPVFPFLNQFYALVSPIFYTNDWPPLKKSIMLYVAFGQLFNQRVPSAWDAFSLAPSHSTPINQCSSPLPVLRPRRTGFSQEENLSCLCRLIWDSHYQHHHVLCFTCTGLTIIRNLHLVLLSLSADWKLHEDWDNVVSITNLALRRDSLSCC